MSSFQLLPYATSRAFTQYTFKYTSRTKRARKNSQAEFSQCLTEQNRVLSRFHFAERFYPNTIFSEQFH